MVSCYHCGDPCKEETISYQEKSFCCNGCKTVFEILSSNDLSEYYKLSSTPGAKSIDIQGKYDFLDDTDIIEKLLEFNDGDTKVISLYIPHIHCSSCIWILENLDKLMPGILRSQVNFTKKSLQITFSSVKTTLKKIVLLLNKIGYEPYISLDDYQKDTKKINRGLIYRLGIAGFAFGNVMFLSFPEYFEVGEYWLDQYKYLFRWLMFSFSLPVVFYSASDYFISAVKGLRSKLLNIDIPIALGIIVLFIRSTIEIAFDLGTGFFDSLTGLVFFLLLGKFFQQKTYNFLSFERDYKSYFPIAVTKIFKGRKEKSIPVYEIRKGDRILIRNEEIIPVDAVLISDHAQLDYSFVTGEAKAIEKVKGDMLFAGGKQLSGSVEIEAVKTVDQSYLTQLWSSETFKKEKKTIFQTLTDRISKRFTLSVLTIASLAACFWLFYESARAMDVFTAVLIIACPCAIALASPFTLGNVIRIFGKQKFYLKNTTVIEQMASIDTIVFDKTGTITTNLKSSIVYEGVPLTEEEEVLLKSTLRESNHPLSRQLYHLLKTHDILTLDEYKEHLGKGLEGSVKNQRIKIGSTDYIGKISVEGSLNTSVHISSNDNYKGQFIFQSQYREGLREVFEKLEKEHSLIILSGDNEGEKPKLKKLLPKPTHYLFNQKPDDKLIHIKSLQEKQNRLVMMVGDGLNDAGALMQSDVGIAVSENINVFSPACDAILDASEFKKLPYFISFSKRAVAIIKWSFIFSLLYNAIGLCFAVSGHLTPIVAAILMPLSSISIVLFTTIATNISASFLIDHKN